MENEKPIYYRCSWRCSHAGAFKENNTRQRPNGSRCQHFKISEDEILIALNDKKGIQSATQTVIRSWLKKQSNRHEVYNTLHRELRRYDMNEMAAMLKESVEGTATQVDLSLERKQFLRVPISFRRHSAPLKENGLVNGGMSRFILHT